MHASAAPHVYARAEELPFKDNVFYAVTYIVSLRYASDLARALAEARRVLKKGGRIVVLENPPLQNWLRHHLTFWTKVEGERCLGFTKKDIAGLFAAARFSNTAVKRYLYGLGVMYIGEKQES
jgi:ubiquinone/menaquinone biosynthesis C-methylase UbiE